MTPDQGVEAHERGLSPFGRMLTAASAVTGALVIGGHLRRGQTARWQPPGGTVVRVALSVRIVGSGPVRLVLLHGMFGSGRYWGARYDELAGDGTLLVPDLLGFGQSPRPASGYTAAAHADAVADTMRSSGASTPVVVAAHSLGSLVAIHLAARHPDLVAAIVAISPPLYATPADARHHIGRSDPLARMFIANQTLAEQLCDLMCRHRTIAGALVRAGRPTLPWPLAADGVQHSWPSYSETLANVIISADSTAVVTGLDIPVRLLTGDRDRILDRKFLASLTSHSHIDLTEVAKGGHALPLSHPEVCIVALERALHEVVHP